MILIAEAVLEQEVERTSRGRITGPLRILFWAEEAENLFTNLRLTH